MKKICYVTTVPTTLKSFVIPVVAQMNQQVDWEFTMVTDSDPDFARLLPEGVRYIPVPMERGISIGGIGAMLRMIRVFRKEKFDLVQYSTPNASLYASLAAWIARVPVRLYCQWGIAYVGFRGIKRKIFKAIEKLVCSLSTWVEPDSFGNLNFSHEEGLYPAGKGSVVWNGSASGVNLQKFDITRKEIWREAVRERYGIGRDDFVYGFIGRITGDKGINELFRAGRQILGDDPDAWLMLVGNMEKTESVDPTLLDWAKGESRVLFCGYTDVVEQYLSAMDVYVLPSYREGFGSAVVEAEAMGVPVIVSDIPGPTDAMLAGETGLVVKKADADSLEQGMRRLRRDEPLRRHLAQNACRFAAERFEQTGLVAHILADRKRLLGLLDNND